MNKHTTLPQLLLGMDEGIKEIRELLHNDVDRKAHENALFTVAKHERLLDDLREILTNHHLWNRKEPPIRHSFSARVLPKLTQKTPQSVEKWEKYKIQGNP